MQSVILISFGCHKVKIPFTDDSCEIPVSRAKEMVADAARYDSNPVEADDVKIIFKGKVLGDEIDLSEFLLAGSKTSKTTYRLVATGVSRPQLETMEREFQEGAQKSAITVRDDLSDKGQQKMRERQRIGRQMMNKAKDSQVRSYSSMYGFGTIDPLPNLPDETKAREILTAFTHDPGVKACMAKHKWKVGSLAELYPKGKVGESEVCVMGLNRNKGQQILLRIRTDDLKGFRKILSIREVLYHELAHNVYSEHDSDFFQLMRQIKKECIEMDWTRGNGTAMNDTKYTITGGSYILGRDSQSEMRLSVRELAGRAAMLRLSAEEEEIRRNCGCGLEQSLFIPNEDRYHTDTSQTDEDS